MLRQFEIFETELRRCPVRRYLSDKGRQKVPGLIERLLQRRKGGHRGGQPGTHAQDVLGCDNPGFHLGFHNIELALLIIDDLPGGLDLGPV